MFAQLISEDVWMGCLRQVIEQKDRVGFELMGLFTSPLVGDCIFVDRLAVPGQPRPAVMKRIHRGHPRQEAMPEVLIYL